jgi:enoyl-CoA hydratase/carnithine racemase
MTTEQPRTGPGGDVTFVEHERLAILSLNRPDDGNRLTGGVFAALTRHLDQLAEAGRVDVLLLRAEGPDFSLGRVPASGPSPTAAQLQDEFRRVQRCNEALAAFAGVSIAAVQGRALGAGASLAGRCDVVLAADDARFAFPEVLHAIPPTIVMAYYAKALPRKALVELVLTGREIDPQEARRIGLVSRVVPAADLAGQARALADQLLDRDPQTLRTCKRFLARVDRLSMEDAADYGIALLANQQASRA